MEDQIPVEFKLNEEGIKQINKYLDYKLKKSKSKDKELKVFINVESKNRTIEVGNIRTKGEVKFKDLIKKYAQMGSPDARKAAKLLRKSKDRPEELLKHLDQNLSKEVARSEVFELLYKDLLVYLK